MATVGPPARWPFATINVATLCNLKRHNSPPAENRNVPKTGVFFWFPNPPTTLVRLPELFDRAAILAKLVRLHFALSISTKSAPILSHQSFRIVGTHRSCGRGKKTLFVRAGALMKYTFVKLKGRRAKNRILRYIAFQRK